MAKGLTKATCKPSDRYWTTTDPLLSMKVENIQEENRGGRWGEAFRPAPTKEGSGALGRT